MRNFLIGIILSVSSAAALSAGTITQTTYTGEVGDVHGDTSFFGPAGISVYTPTTHGTAYQLVYTVSDDINGAISSSTATSTRIEGPYVVSAALTINGITQYITGSNESSAENNNAQIISGVPTDRSSDESREYSVTSAAYHDFFAQSYISSNDTDFLSNADYHTPFTHTYGGDDSLYNYVYFNHFDYTTQTQVVNLYLNLGPGTVSSVTFNSGNAEAPEPSTWLQMIGGASLLGVMALNKRRSASR